MVNMQAALVSFAGARNIMGGLDGPKPSEEETKGITRHNEWMQAHAQKNVNKALAEVEEFLGKNEWFSGSKDIGEGDVSFRRVSRANMTVHDVLGPQLYRVRGPASCVPDRSQDSRLG